MKVASGTVYLCTDDVDMIKSKRIFMRTLALYAEMIGGLSEIQRLAFEEVRNEGRRLVHNLTTLNSHIIRKYTILFRKKNWRVRRVDRFQ